MIVYDFKNWTKNLKKQIVYQNILLKLFLFCLADLIQTLIVILFQRLFLLAIVKKSVEYILWSYAILLVGIAYVCGLFIDVTGDSGLYAAISRQMVESGNWLNLKINGVPYDQKPHLFFWLAGLGIRLFGNTNFAFKLFPFLWALAGIYFTYKLGKLLFSKEAGKWAVLIMATSQITFLYFFDLHTDTVLFPGVILALWQLASHLKTGKSTHFILGFLGIGLAMLSKGPVGAILPFFAVLYYFFMKKDFRPLFHYKWILGVLLAFAIVSPALIHLYNNFGWDGIRFYFITNNFGRISGEYAGSSTDPFYYLHTILWAFLPWTVFIIAAVISSMKKGFNPVKPDVWVAYLFGGVLVLVVVLSMAKGKAPNYFFIAVPPFSILAGNWIAPETENSQKTKQSVLVILWIVCGLMFSIFGLAMYINLGNNNWLPVALITLLLAAIVFIFRTQKKKLERIILISIILTGTVNVFMNVSVIPHLYNYQGARQVLEVYEKNKQKGERLYKHHAGEFELFFYAADSVKQISTYDDYEEMLGQNRIWIYTSNSGYDQLKKNLGDRNVLVIPVKQLGMNHITLDFLNPYSRGKSLETNFMVYVK